MSRRERAKAKADKKWAERLEAERLANFRRNHPGKATAEDVGKLLKFFLGSPRRAMATGAAVLIVATGVNSTGESSGDESSSGSTPPAVEVTRSPEEAKPPGEGGSEQGDRQSPPAEESVTPSQAASPQAPAEGQGEASDPTQIEFDDGISGGHAQDVVEAVMGELPGVRLLGQDGSGFQSPSNAAAAEEMLQNRQEDNASANPGINAAVNAAEVNCSTFVRADKPGLVSAGTLEALTSEAEQVNVGQVGSLCLTLVVQSVEHGGSQFYKLHY